MKRAARLCLIPSGLYLLAALLPFLAATGWGVPELSAQQRIQEVIKGSPAERAGLQQGDVMVSIAGEPVDTEHPVSAVIARSAGRPVRVGIERSGIAQEIVVRPAQGRLGVQLMPVENCRRLAAGEAARRSITYPLYAASMLFRSLRAQRTDVAGPIQIRTLMDFPCTRRNRYVANASAGLAILSLLSILIPTVVLIRARWSPPQRGG